MSELPNGWAQARLTDIIDLHDSRRIPLNKEQRQQRQGPYPYYGANGLVDHIDDYLFDGAYVLLAEDGGYFDDPARGVAYEASGKFWVNNHAHILSPRGNIPHRLLTHLLNSIEWLPYVGGSTRLKLTQAGMQQIPLPVPPLPEQRRIVAKLDSLRARSARAHQELDHIPHLIESYKQAILAKAFSGELTKDWRRSHGASDWKQGNAGPYFKWASGKFLPKSKQFPGQITVYGGNGPNGLHDTALVTEPTLVIGRVGAHCGNVHLTSGPAWVTDNAIYASEIAAPVDAQFALLLFRNANLNADAGGSGQPFVNQTILNETEFPLLDMAEQREIVRLVHLASTWLDKIVTEHARAEHLLPKLDQAILAKAFRGELVPQDPNDEPASVLLERIKAERAGADQPRRRRARA